MVSTLSVEFECRRVEFRVTPLEVVQILASRAGCYDVDMKDNDRNNVKIVATRHTGHITVKAASISEAAEKFMEKVIPELGLERAND